jgi:hypothetical protein
VSRRSKWFHALPPSLPPSSNAVCPKAVSRQQPMIVMPVESLRTKQCPPPHTHTCARCRALLLERASTQQCQGSDARNYDWLVAAMDQLKVAMMGI